MIVLENVSKTYDGGKTFSVHRVSLNVPRGSLLALLGGSGCGKTTTLKMINRLNDPTSGRIIVNGDDVMRLDPVQLRRSIGYVFQGSGLFPHMSVAENIAVVPRLLQWPTDRIRKRVDELLGMVRLPAEQFLDRLPRQLSGGQQQRVGFARALAAEQKVILLDEPFGALDPKTRIELRGDFLKLRRQLGLTAVMVTHDMLEALLSADLIAVMKEGCLLQIGAPEELRARPADPYVSELIDGPLREMKDLKYRFGAEKEVQR
jgi:osmoprotectant transport system ATP-binding protein